MNLLIKYIRKILNENIENKLNKYVYHKANPIFRSRIEKSGIIIHRGIQWLGNTPIKGDAVFATNSDNQKDWFDSTFDDDIWRIDTKKIPDIKWFADPNFVGIKSNKHIYAQQSIPRNAIELIKKGTGKDLT